MLNTIQATHIAKVFPECRNEMVDFLTRGVDVFISYQDECGTDAPPFAIQVVEQPDFWIDCAESSQLASQLARNLGLRIIEI